MLPINNTKLFVTKRGGFVQDIVFDKIRKRIESLCYNLNADYVHPSTIVVKVVAGLYPGVSTAELDTLAAETAASMMTLHPDYGVLAARIAISNMHKQTDDSFARTMKELYAAGLISMFHYDVVCRHGRTLDEAIVHANDFNYSYFGIKTLERSYLMHIKDRLVERPQYLLMRCALGIHGENIDAVIETYNYMSRHYFTHATPTLFSAATPKPQLSSCYLLTIKGDSIDGIFQTVADCAAISKTAGGIGLNVHDIRARGTPIDGTNGKSNGLVPMLRVFNNVARYVDQGGGKRMGSFAIYLEPWHADIFEFLELRKNHGIEEQRARDLFYALWIPDLFMRRVEQDGDWSLMCPHKCPCLSEVWGESFEHLYEHYERKGKAVRTVKARALWHAIIESQVETGTPYMMYKDACNRKSNQQNLGTIRCSNLCTEIVEYTAPDEIAVCNLASLALPKFVVTDTERATKRFDFEQLRRIVHVVTRNLNRIIDINYYPVPEARRSNLRHRPIGIGVQGLADTFILMGMAYESDEARELNRRIFETIYFAALETSCQLAKEEGVYESFLGSPASCGTLQQDMWPLDVDDKPMWNWDELRHNIEMNGLRNSLLVAPMPTASTAQILGNTESFEPLTSNLYVRRVLSGEFQVINRHLVQHLIDLGLWSETMRNRIIARRGSVQDIEEIPIEVRRLYKTVWEISGRRIIDMAADRGRYIDQSQSMNMHVAEPNYAKLSSMHFYAWRAGLKTGMYYLRTKAAANAIQFTVDSSSSGVSSSSSSASSTQDGPACTRECLSCGS